MRVLMQNVPTTRFSFDVTCIKCGTTIDLLSCPRLADGIPMCFLTALLLSWSRSITISNCNLCEACHGISSSVASLLLFLPRVRSSGSVYGASWLSSTAQARRKCEKCRWTSIRNLSILLPAEQAGAPAQQSDQGVMSQKATRKTMNFPMSTLHQRTNSRTIRKRKLQGDALGNGPVRL
ncbi:hypothetical protein FOYG_17600 [Fusarium oxysporum NRRL 32931]|uniref:Uncharacterized protein n=1 Tax=Fusarium oxysporum NRRL 32931 TaxID=660029 RepID=W9HDX4_FUSOX|nr:hypothetical protein FOYG_17600 [Fusarium oxysporum NRRL 32931]